MKTFSKPNIELADIFRQFGHLLGPLPKAERKVIQAIKNCRTSILGGHKSTCDSCDYEKKQYNSCRNRHCPKCQFLTRSEWIEKRSKDLLPCQYFHVVFTLPSELRPLILRNKEIGYRLLLKAASETLKEVAANPKNLGAEIGCIAVLHTWAQNLIDHPHVHFIVPGGGLNKDKWRPCKRNYFLPVKILSQVFRAKILKGFRAAFDDNELTFPGKIAYLEAAANFQNLLSGCAGKEFVVYSKETFAGPEQVINYLGQYTHRIAISNYRLVKIEGEMIEFKVRDRSDPTNKKTMRLHVKEFMRRFLSHVLPKGFVRIRHYGLLGNRNKKQKLAIIRQIHGMTSSTTTAVKEVWKDLLYRLTGIEADRCPKCKLGRMIENTFFEQLINSS